LVQIDSPDKLFTRALAEPAIAQIATFLHAFPSPVYLVGGAIRDLILGRELLDVDLAVDGDPVRLGAAFGRDGDPETRFGTLTVQREGNRYDLARTRTELYRQPGALPEVEPAGIDADLARRDFTVNALALALNGERAGELFAAPAALEDLAAGRLAVLHDRSFLDDPTRLLRLARYAARLGFEPTPRTRALAAAAIADNALDTISGTRIGNELRLLAGEPDPVEAFEAVAELGLPWTIDTPLARQALEVLPVDGRRDLVALAGVFTGKPQKQVLAELDNLGFAAADRDALAEGAGRAGELAQRLLAATSGAGIARTVGSFGIETVALASSQGASSQARVWLQDLRHRRLDMTGGDLIEHGMAEGPRLGAALQRARDALMDGTALDRESQLRVALQAAE
jgi:tRNA nucleotidyltransferase (CCA-adding enzyme)